MPAYLKPGLRVPVWLNVDEHDDPRPTFYSRVLTMPEQEALGEAIDTMHASTDQTTADLFARGRALLCEYIDSWEHLPADFSFELLSYAEVRQLLHKIAYGQFTDPVEKKECERPPSSAAENCAESAA